MQTLVLQNYCSRDIATLAEFFTHYLKKYPDAKLSGPEFYTYHPALEDGENVFCVLNPKQQMVGFAPMFPVLTTTERPVTSPPDIWTIILARPDLGAASEVRELLFSKVVERAQRLKAVHTLSRVRLAADLMVSQRADLEFLRQKGFEPFERVYVMRCATAEIRPALSVPTEITFRSSKLASPSEQATYLDVFNTCFPENPKTIEAVQFFFQSPLWEQGQMIGAYTSSNELVGSSLVYWDAQRGCGVTDDVMVLPPWRGQNIAKRLIGEGIRYFAAHGIPEAQLEVRASNVAAVSAYRSMGYRVINQECLLGKLI